MEHARAMAALAATAVLWLASRGIALGDVPSFSLTWSAPADECPDEGYVRASIEQLVAGGSSMPAPVDASARVERGADGRWRVHLTTMREGARGERVLDSRSCRSLADATALIVALTIDPERVAANQPAARPAPTGDGGPVSPGSLDGGATGSASGAPDAGVAPPGELPPPPPPAAPASAPAAIPAPARTRTDHPVPAATASPDVPTAPGPRAPYEPPAFRGPRVAVLAAVGGDVGTLPQPAYSLELALALRLAHLRVEAFGAFWPYERAHVPSAPSFGGEVDLAAGGVRGCYVPFLGSFELGACPGLEFGILHGQGLGVRTPRQADSVWLAATASVRGSWVMSPRFALTLDVGFAVPLLPRDLFILDEYGTIHQAASVEGRALVGPELRF